MNVIDWLALTLVVVGALNWGLIGLGHFVDAAANWNIVNVVFGSIPELEFAIYLLVGLAGLYELYFASKVAGDETTEPEMETSERTTPK